MKPAKPFKITYTEHVRLHDLKITCEVESLNTPGELWVMVDWNHQNAESTWQKMTKLYPGKIIVMARCSYGRRINQLPYLYLLHKTVAEAVTEVLEGK